MYLKTFTHRKTRPKSRGRGHLKSTLTTLSSTRCNPTHNKNEGLKRPRKFYYLFFCPSDLFQCPVDPILKIPGIHPDDSTFPFFQHRGFIKFIYFPFSFPVSLIIFWVLFYFIWFDLLILVMDQPGSQSSEEDENVIVVPIDRSFSDGDPAIWPKEERFQMPDDTHYREKLATMWLKKMGAYEEGISFFIFPLCFCNLSLCILR